MEKVKQRDERNEAGDVDRKECLGKSNWQYPDSKLEIRGPFTMPLLQHLSTYLSIDPILWEFKETEDQRMNMDMRKEQWINGKKGMEKIVDYAKEIGLYNGI
jgi:hypothetical protein